MRVLAVDIGGTAIKAGLVEEDGVIFNTKDVPYQGTVNKDTVVAALMQTVASYQGFERIGVSTTAHVEPDGSIGYASANIPGYGGTPLRKMLEEQFQVPVRAVRDSTAMAWGEIAFGAGKQYKDFVCVTYGSGVGGAIVINSKPYLGTGGSAGQFGHLVTHEGGELCQCGARGCYEAYASAAALSKKVQKETGTAYSGREIFVLMEGGDLGMKRLVDEWAHEVTVGLVSIVHSLDPACIVLGGGVMEQAYSLDFVQRNIYNMVIKASKNFVIKRAVLGNSTNLLGAAQVAWRL